MQDQFRERAGRNDLGVREQGLLVLAQTSMPGVLVEAGFISNAEEEKFLMSEYGQDIIASAIFRGFREYKEAIDGRSNMSVDIREQETEAAEAVAQTREIPPESLSFRIQLASSRKLIPTDPSAFKGYENISVVQDGRWYKYLLGSEPSYQDALNLCEQVKKDYPDAFVVAVKNNQMQALKKAIEESNSQ